MSLVATIERDRDMLIRLAQKRIPNPEDAPDIVQRAVVKTIKASRRQTVDPRGHVSYLARAVRSEIAETYRSRNRQVPELPIDDFVHIGSEDQHADDLEILLKLVPPHYGQLVSSLIQHEGDHIAVQRELGMNPNSYRTRLSRMRRAVQRIMKEQGL